MSKRLVKASLLLSFVTAGIIMTGSLTGCTVSHKTIKEAPTPTTSAKADEYPVPVYATSLKGQKICLDPGHGGDADVPNYKRGPSGVREAEVNLRVALYLQKWLEECGAQVYLTRTTDVFVGLRERSVFADTCGAEYFVSMHHNAVSNPSVNFTSTWYHASPDYGPLNLDIARYIQDGVGDALGLPFRASIPLKSDYTIYPDAGFAVLRNTHIPAALCEASFHSNPVEEKKLDNPDYNKREAYGYFVGLAKLFYSGIPQAEIISPSSVVSERNPLIQFKIDDGLKGRQILEETLTVKLDGQSIPYTYDRSSGVISAVSLTPLTNNYHTAQVHFMNLNKTSVYPKHLKFQVAPPLASLSVKAYPTSYPDNGETIGCMKVEASDAEGNPVADGMELNLSADQGVVLTSKLTTLNGYALGYWQAPAQKGSVVITAAKGNILGVAGLSIESSSRALLQGKIFYANSNKPVEKAQIAITSLSDHPITESLPDGFFSLSGVYPGSHWVVVTAPGCKELRIPMEFKANQTVKIQVNMEAD